LTIEPINSILGPNRTFYKKDYYHWQLEEYTAPDRLPIYIEMVPKEKHLDLIVQLLLLDIQLLVMLDIEHVCPFILSALNTGYCGVVTDAFSG
jgi:hypothetical protein